MFIQTSFISRPLVWARKTQGQCLGLSQLTLLKGKKGIILITTSSNYFGQWKHPFATKSLPHFTLVGVLYWIRKIWKYISFLYNHMSFLDYIGRHKNDFFFQVRHIVKIKLPFWILSGFLAENIEKLLMNTTWSWVAHPDRIGLPNIRLVMCSFSDVLLPLFRES